MSFRPSFVLRYATLLLCALLSVVDQSAADGNEPLELSIRERVSSDGEKVEVKVGKRQWDPKKTAVVICDMWDKHWCQGATRRVAEMAPHMEAFVQNARERGILIIHCPSSCLSFYKDSPMRKLAQQAPPVKTEIPLQSWCHLDDAREGKLPIDDSDNGCDCWPRCQTGSPWRRQIDTISVLPGDAVTDNEEAFYLMKQRGIENVMVVGVHTNMCVLGRPFSIRQMVYQGQNVVLVRDLTDTMYNSRRPPYVPHVRGTGLVVEHIERYWCPTIVSSDLTGEKPFRFSEADKPHVVFLIGEREYKTKDTLPFFARHHLESRGVRCTIVHADAQDGNNFPGIDAVRTADLLFVSVRRRALPQAQLELIRNHLERGKPLVGIRTANHAFHTRGQKPDGHAEWQEFDAAVLGGNYTGHHKVGPATSLEAAKTQAEHPILKQVAMDSFQGSGSLYKVSPLAETAIPLVFGSIPDESRQPIAWTHQYGDARVFYTSLGHPDDFKSDAFNRLLTNAVMWGLERKE